MILDSPAAKRIREAHRRTIEVLPRMRDVFIYSLEEKGLVYKIDFPPRGKKGQLAGGANQRGVRQVMFEGFRYVDREIIYAIYSGKWPHKTLSYRDGDCRNISPDNLFIKE